jgi:putative IMPACT (imprinted ancient) family translation regulator
VSGLIQAYREATADALRQATVTERVVEDLITLTFDYAKMSDVMNALKILQIPTLQQDFLENATLIIAIRQSETDDKLLRLRAAVGKLHLEEAQLMKKIDGFSVVITGIR